jgi:ribosomal protein S18 acetylase RimI-like enzyme
MKFVIWGKAKIAQLNDIEKNQWFDVLNNGLEEDRGISLDNPKIKELQDSIKTEYLKYLHDCARTAYYFSYFVLYDEESKIVSVCRVIEKDHQYYLEGLETHRQFCRLGYASTLVQEVILHLKECDVPTLRSSISVKNHPSIQFHKSMGFKLYDETEHKVRFQYNIMGHPRYLPVILQRLWPIQLIWGIPYHKDNNKKYYTSSYRELITNLIVTLVLLDVYSFFVDTLTLFILINVLLLFLINAINGIRYVTRKDNQYRNAVLTFARSSTLVVSISIIVLIVVYSFI